MKYQEALQLKQRNVHLIGQTYKGGEIEDLVVAPTEQRAWQNFVRNYVMNDYDGDIAILPFTNFDVDVVALFNRDYIDSGMFFFSSLNSLKDGLEIK